MLNSRGDMQTYHHTNVQGEGNWWGEGYWNPSPCFFVVVVVVCLFVCLFGFLLGFFGDTVKVVPRLRDSDCRFLCPFGLSGICDTRGACMDR